ncbi:hypothetical protein BDR22DRAFT_260465 [Usnea florida]
MPSTEAKTGVPDQSSVLQFHLFGLPLDLRIMIYEVCLLSPGEIIIQRVRHDQEQLISRKRQVPNVNVLLVSRQVYGEAAPVMYGCNTFKFYLQPDGSTDFNLFESRLSSISRNRIYHLDFNLIPTTIRYKVTLYDMLSNLKRLPRLKVLRILVLQDMGSSLLPLMQYIERSKGNAEVRLLIRKLRFIQRLSAVHASLLDAMQKWNWTVAGDFLVKGSSSVTTSRTILLDPSQTL